MQQQHSNKKWGSICHAYCMSAHFMQAGSSSVAGLKERRAEKIEGTGEGSQRRRGSEGNGWRQRALTFISMNEIGDGGLGGK